MLDPWPSLEQIAGKKERNFWPPRYAVMGRALRPGDDVEWNTSQGKTRGRVVKKQTRATKIKGHQVAASQDNPEYIVQSAKSGKRAAHKRSALQKR